MNSDGWHRSTIRAEALNFYGTPYEAITAGERAVALASGFDRLGWLVRRVRARSGLFHRGPIPRCRTAFERAAARLASAPENVPPGTTGFEPSRAVPYDEGRSFMRRSANLTSSEQCARQASDLAEKNGRPYDIVAADYAPRPCAIDARQSRGGRKRSRSEAAFLSRENEVRLFLPLVLCALGNLYLQQWPGREGQGHPARGKGRSGGAWSCDRHLLGVGLSGFGVCQLGDIPRGLEVARACAGGAKQKGYQSVEALAFFTEAGILSLQGASASAEAMVRLERSIEIAARLGTRPLLGLAKGVLARLLIASGRDVRGRDSNSSRRSNCLTSRK